MIISIDKTHVNIKSVKEKMLERYYNLALFMIILFFN